MRRLIPVLVLLLCVCFGPNLYACTDCIARHCADDGIHTVCDEFPDNHGCIASGYCPPSPMGCINGKLTMQVASVQVVEPKAGNFFLSNVTQQPFLAASNSAGYMRRGF